MAVKGPRLAEEPISRRVGWGSSGRKGWGRVLGVTVVELPSAEVMIDGSVTVVTLEKLEPLFTRQYRVLYFHSVTSVTADVFAPSNLGSPGQVNPP